MTERGAANLIETSFTCADGVSMPALVMIPNGPRSVPPLLFISGPFGFNRNTFETLKPPINESLAFARRKFERRMSEFKEEFPR